MRYGSGAAWTDPQATDGYLQRCHDEMAGGEVVQLGIVRREDDAFVGICNLRDFDTRCRRAEVGYSLLPSAWGHGYANEAVSALLDWGFDRMDLNRVEADIDPRNAPSARALERLGFVQEGHLRERWIVDGEVCDSWIYGLLRADWRARRDTHAA